MDPIVLNEFGETLIQLPGSSITTDAKQISFGSSHCTFLGFHGLCGGCIAAYQVSENYYRIRCNYCNFTDVIPMEVDTYGKLRQWLAQKVE